MVNSEYRWKARVYRIVSTQPGGPGTEIVPSEDDIISEIFCKWDMSRSKEEFANGAFAARNYPKIWFFWPGFGVDIRQGDHVAINYNDVDKDLIITGVISPNSQKEAWCIECQEEAEAGACA